MEKNIEEFIKMGKCPDLETKQIIDLIDMPICYGNFCNNDTACQKCNAKISCQKIPPPKEPRWCNPP